MNILLIYPEIPDTFWSFKHVLKFIGKKAALPPLGLLTVAAMLPEEWKKDLRLIDLNVGTKVTNEDLKQADLVLISGMILQRDSAIQIIKRCKNAGVKVVAGGPLFTMEYEDFKSVDHLFLGEVTTELLKQFAKDLQNGAAKHIYRLDKFPDLTTTPPPMWRLLRPTLKLYAGMAIQISQGCPHNCDFCNVTLLFGHKVRIKTIDQVIAELDSLYQLGWQRGVGILFVDDNLIGNVRFLKKKLLPALIKWQKDKHIAFSAQVTIRLADDTELMELMIEAGFRTLFVGIETPCKESLIYCNKQSNTERDMIQDINSMQQHGFIVNGGFIVGFDKDPPDIFKQQINFIQKSGVVTAMVGILQAPPGTKLFERLEKAGRIVGFVTGDNFLATNIRPCMNIKVLQEGLKEILGSIYNAKPYYYRIKTFLKEYKPPKERFSSNANYILIGIRVIVSFGILDKGRKYFWKLLFWTLFTRPKLVPLAITLFIYGHHFRKIADL